jgi:hypothetical protein
VERLPQRAGQPNLHLADIGADLDCRPGPFQHFQRHLYGVQVVQLVRPLGVAGNVSNVVRRLHSSALGDPLYWYCSFPSVVVHKERRGGVYDLMVMPWGTSTEQMTENRMEKPS